MCLKSKAAESEVFIPVIHCLEGLSSEELKSNAVCPSLGFTFSERNRGWVLQGHFVSEVCQMGSVKRFLPKAHKLHVNINIVTTISKLTVEIFASGCALKSRPEFLEDLFNNLH